MPSPASRGDPQALAPTLGTPHDRFDLHLDIRAASLPLAELRQTARRYALNPNLSALLPESGDRTWACLAGTLASTCGLSVAGRHRDRLHDHGEASGRSPSPPASSSTDLGPTAVQHRTLAEGDARAFGRDHVHNVIGAGPGRALTVHAYAPGL